jgi:hypothetical protein
MARIVLVVLAALSLSVGCHRGQEQVAVRHIVFWE